MKEAIIADTLEDAQCLNPECQEVRAALARVAELHQHTAKALAGAAHDFSTPLAIIAGYVDLLKKERLGPVSDRQMNVYGEIQASIVRLTNLVQDFLLFSQFETGGFRILPEQGDVVACVAETVDLWRSRFAHRHVTLQTIDADQVAPFPFDQRRVQRVLSNLLDNALRHTGKDGAVWVRVEPVFWERRNPESRPAIVERRRGSVTAPNAARISVIDNGPGIAAEYHQEIFEDFFRLDDTSEGVGLGLGIVRRIVEAHRGKVWVESQPGAGATFCFNLPFSPTLPSARPAGTGQ